MIPTTLAPINNRLLIFASKDPAMDQSDMNINANGNYSNAGVGVTRFRVKPPINEVWQLNKLIVTIRDNGLFNNNKYGAGTTLTNGIDAEYLSAGVTLGLLPRKVFINIDWNIYADDYDLTSAGAGDNSLSIRWYFLRNSVPIYLDGGKLEEFCIILNDDFSGISNHYASFGGFRFPISDVTTRVD